MPAPTDADFIKMGKAQYREQQRKEVKSRARRSALKRLAAAHPDEYKRLLTEEENKMIEGG